MTMTVTWLEPYCHKKTWTYFLLIMTSAQQVNKKYGDVPSVSYCKRSLVEGQPFHVQQFKCFAAPS